VFFTIVGAHSVRLFVRSREIRVVSVVGELVLSIGSRRGRSSQQRLLIAVELDGACCEESSGL
jgi:hypothetical protein